MPESRDITWNEFHWDCRLVATRIATVLQDNNKSIGLLCVARGGLVVGRLIDGHLRSMGLNPSLGVISSQGYDGTEQSDTQTTGEPYWLTGEQPEVVVIIDDMVDTGRTLDSVKAVCKEHDMVAMTAVVYFKPSAKQQPNIYAHMVDDRWLRFPFETEDMT